MAAAKDATPALHRIVKEAVDVGVGLHSLYKAFTNPLQQSAGDAQRGGSHLQVEAAQVQQDSGDLRGDMKAARQAIEKAIDNQASLLALVSQGPARVCSGELDALQQEIEKGFDSVMQSVQDKTAIPAAQELKRKLGQAALACNRMVEGVVAAAENQQRQFPPGVMGDIENAERTAAELQIWANSFVPSNPEAVTKESQLQTMPYIVTMAFAARVQAITHILERNMIERECDQIPRLERARKVMDDFMAVLERAMAGVMANTSLLEVATVYQLPMAMYLTFMTGFRASIDEQLQSPSAEPRDIVVWDDGLSPIRDVLHWKANDADDDREQIIEFSSIEEGMWWLTFTNTDPATTNMRELMTSIHIRDLCAVLGAEDYDPRCALIPGRKSALLQLPPASALRSALCANIAQARQAIHTDRSAPASLPQSFACLQAAVPRTLIGCISTVNGVAVCPDGEHLVTGSIDGTVRLWSLKSGQQLRTFSGHTNSVNSVAVSPDGKTVVSGSIDKSVRVWSLESGCAQHILQEHTGWVWGVAVSPDGRSIASGSRDRTVKLWNVESGQCQATLTGHSHNVICVAFSPDGATLVSGSADGSIRVWNAHTGAFQRSLHGHSQVVAGVAVTPDGRRVVSGSWDETVRVWSLSSGAEEMKFEGHTCVISSVAAFPDGERIASGSWDETVRVWNLRSNALEMTLRGCTSYVMCVAVLGDGQNVISGSNAIKMWDLSGNGGGRGRAIGSNDQRFTTELMNPLAVVP